MAKISDFIRRYRHSKVLKALINFLEDVDLPGPVKKSIVVAIVKALQVKTGGKWDKEMQAAIEGIIEWVLQEVREEAEKWGDIFDEPLLLPPSQPPVISDPPVIEEPSLYRTAFHTQPNWQEYEDGDQVFVNSKENPTVWYVLRVTEAPQLLPTTLRTLYATVYAGGLVHK